MSPLGRVQNMRLFAGTPYDRPPKCDQCGQLEEECVCPPPPAPRIPPAEQTARISVERRKYGKTVTLVKGLPAVGNDLPELLTHLKSQCGAGGTLKDEALELQGDHLNRVRTSLSALGFRVRG